MKLGELIRAAMRAAFRGAGKVEPQRRREPQKRLQYPHASDPQTIAHHDAQIRAWIAGGRNGARPSRFVKRVQS